MSECGSKGCGCSTVAMPSPKPDTVEAALPQVRYRIENMDCPTEEALIRDKLGKVQGVSSLEFNLVVNSSLVRNSVDCFLAEDSEGRSVAEDLPGAVVKALLDPAQLRVGDRAEIKLARQVLANETVGVFVAATLPGGVRIGEVEVGLQCAGNELMFGKLLAVVAGQRVHMAAQSA